MINFRAAQTLLSGIILIFNIPIHAQSINFGSPSTLFSLDGAHWELSQPMIPVLNADGSHVDFYGLTGSTYKKHTYTAGSYPATTFLLYGDFNFIIDVHDFDGDGKGDILTDADLFKNNGNNIYDRYLFGNISYEMEGTLDYDGDGLRDILITEDDFSTSRTTLYIFRNKGGFTFERIVVEQNKRRMNTVITADINGDKRDDIIITTGIDTKPFVIFISNADGTFTTREIEGNGKYFLPHTLCATDMDKDGDLDLVVMDYEKGLWFFENQDDFTSSIRHKSTSFDPVTDGLSVHCDDLNGDGWPEMIISTLTPSRLTISVSKGTGPFEFDALQEIGFLQGGTTSGFAPQGRAVTRMIHAIDINADNKKDIVLTSTFDKKQVAWINNSVTNSADEILSDIVVYPNPADNFVQVKSEQALSYTIVSITGLPCLAGRIYRERSIDTSTLVPGTYFLILTDHKGVTRTEKLLKQ